MRRLRNCLCILVGLLAVGPGLGDEVTLRSGGRMRGRIQKITFRVDGQAGEHVRDRVTVVRLVSRGIDTDQLVSQDGRRLQGSLISLEIKTIAGVQLLMRKQIASIRLSVPSEAPKASTRDMGKGAVEGPSTRTSKYGDYAKLTYGCQVRGVLLLVRLRVEDQERSYVRGRISSIELCNPPKKDAIVLANGKRLEGQVVSAKLKSLAGTATFKRQELVWLKLSGAGGPEPKEAVSGITPTAQQEKGMAMSKALHDERAKKVQDRARERLAEVQRDVQGKLPDVDLRIRSATGEVKDATDDVKRWSRQAKRESVVFVRRGKPILDITKAMLSQAKASLRAAQKKLAEATSEKKDLLTRLRRTRGAIRQWAASRLRHIKATLAKQKIILLSGGVLTEQQMQSHYQAGLVPCPGQ